MTAVNDRWPQAAREHFLRGLLIPLLVAAVLATAATATKAQAEEDPWQWLQRMGQAMQELSYSGTFIYLHNGQLDTLSIVHSKDDRGERQRLVSLNGEAREVIRNNGTVTCIWPGARSVNVTKAQTRNPLPIALSTDLEGLRSQYRIRFDGEERVAGLQARIIAIEPQDAFRYGYRLWIDQDQYLLVRSDMTNAAGAAVEQVMFTDLQRLDSVPDAAFEPALTGSGYSWQRLDSPNVAAQPSKPDWEVASLPPGFKLTAHNRKFEQSDNTSPVDHLVFSDGLATLSVFIEQNIGKPTLLGDSKMGAVNAFGRRYQGYHVTVVGEVPVQTLRLVGDSVARRH